MAAGDISRLPELAAELAALPADVIVVDGGITVPAVMNATKTIPVVMATAGDPVALGYVQSLSRPGGNVTGFSLISGELNQKRLDLLRAAFPTRKTWRCCSIRRTLPLVQAWLGSRMRARSSESERLLSNYPRRMRY